ncbi:hypothetical protein Pph01_85580 [Planotetraspora phitsanulokensis]|uniref:Uncharacterized protein n=1 Tax=Planotetraspora phitsanulokensis TaxID=575192 RepID=A0A8J3UF51_9ACTN|nr:hypothetical protein Pph01_85580 [Planotetraspora phitsanulokensis]
MNDPAWLGRADLPQVAQAWGAALPYIAQDPAAERARLTCEDRLRELHPYGMRQYDRLRHLNVPPVQAMHEASPYFAREPNPRTGYPAPKRQALPPAGSWPGKTSPPR